MASASINLVENDTRRPYARILRSGVESHGSTPVDKYSFLCIDDNKNEIFVSDPYKPIVRVLDKDTGKLKRLIGKGCLGTTIGMYVDVNQGELFICNIPFNRPYKNSNDANEEPSVKVFDTATGNEKHHFGGLNDNGEPILVEPVSVCASDSKLYVSDLSQNRVVAFSRQDRGWNIGNTIGAAVGNSRYQLHGPTSICINGTGVDAKVYILNLGNQRIHVYKENDMTHIKTVNLSRIGENHGYTAMCISNISNELFIASRNIGDDNNIITVLNLDTLTFKMNLFGPPGIIDMCVSEGSNEVFFTTLHQSRGNQTSSILETSIRAFNIGSIPHMRNLERNGLEPIGGENVTENGRNGGGKRLCRTRRARKIKSKSKRRSKKY